MLGESIFRTCTWRCLVVSWKCGSSAQELRADNKGLELIKKKSAYHMSATIGGGVIVVNKADNSCCHGASILLGEGTINKIYIVC